MSASRQPNDNKVCKAVPPQDCALLTDWAHRDALAIIKTVNERDADSAAAIIAEMLRRIAVEGAIVGIERERQFQDAHR